MKRKRKFSKAAYTYSEIRGDGKVYTHQQDDEPRVVFDSGWYCPIPGRPLPSIEAFRIPRP